MIAQRAEMGPGNGDNTTLTVQDDGVGFDVPDRLSQFVAMGHFGLIGMSEYAIGAGGTFHVHSQPGFGTKVVAQISTQKERKGHDETNSGSLSG